MIRVEEIRHVINSGSIIIRMTPAGIAVLCSALVRRDALSTWCAHPERIV
jgi:hypothetical protein